SEDDPPTQVGDLRAAFALLSIAVLSRSRGRRRRRGSVGARGDAPGRSIVARGRRVWRRLLRRRAVEDLKASANHVHATGELVLAHRLRHELHDGRLVSRQACVDLEVRHDHPGGALARLLTVELHPYRYTSHHSDHVRAVPTLDLDANDLKAVVEPSVVGLPRPKEVPAQDTRQEDRSRDHEGLEPRHLTPPATA